MIIFSSATFVAMLVAEGLRAAKVSPVYVIFLGIALAVCLGGIVGLQLIVDRRLGNKARRIEP